MLIEMIEYGCKTEKEVKAMQSEIRKNIQGTNSEGKETGTQIKDLEQKEEINIQPEQKEETRIQNNEERLRNLWDNFKCSNIWIIGVPGEKRKSKKLKTFEKIMKENFPNLTKEIERELGAQFPFWKLRKSQRNWIQGGTHQDTP